MVEGEEEESMCGRNGIEQEKGMKVSMFPTIRDLANAYGQVSSFTGKKVK